MKVGDILIFINKGDCYKDQSYTENKQYRIYHIDYNTYIPGKKIGWIKDDKGGKVYFSEEEMYDDNWISLKDFRKLKLQKLNSIK